MKPNRLASCLGLLTVLVARAAFAVPLRKSVDRPFVGAV